jgi:hypothetical protein
MDHGVELLLPVRIRQRTQAIGVPVPKNLERLEDDKCDLR